jgi:hypothetical protein
MRRCLVSILLCACFAEAQEFVRRPELIPEPPKRGLWKASLAVLVAAQVLDIHSSVGYPEANRLLRSSGGTFGAKAVGIKVGLSGVVALTQYLTLRRSHRSATRYSTANLAVAGAMTGIAIRNYSIRGQCRR